MLREKNEIGVGVGMGIGDDVGVKIEFIIYLISMAWMFIAFLIFHVVWVCESVGFECLNKLQFSRNNFKVKINSNNTITEKICIHLDCLFNVDACLMNLYSNP